MTRLWENHKWVSLGCFVGFSQKLDLQDFCWIWVRYFSKNLTNSWKQLNHIINRFRMFSKDHCKFCIWNVVNTRRIYLCFRDFLTICPELPHSFYVRSIMDDWKDLRNILFGIIAGLLVKALSHIWREEFCFIFIWIITMNSPDSIVTMNQR